VQAHLDFCQCLFGIGCLCLLHSLVGCLKVGGNNSGVRGGDGLGLQLGSQLGTVKLQGWDKSDMDGQGRAGQVSDQCMLSMLASGRHHPLPHPPPHDQHRCNKSLT
jgi:hypothetical protein